MASVFIVLAVYCVGTITLSHCIDIHVYFHGVDGHGVEVYGINIYHVS